MTFLILHFYRTLFLSVLLCKSVFSFLTVTGSFSTTVIILLYDNDFQCLSIIFLFYNNIKYIFHCRVRIFYTFNSLFHLYFFLFFLYIYFLLFLFQQLFFSCFYFVSVSKFYIFPTKLILIYHFILFV